jgi:hypothetical protein
MRRHILTSATFLLLAAGAAAQPAPVGIEFQGNITTAGQQAAPAANVGGRVLDDVKALVDRAIDSTIRGFNPDEPSSFERWDKELQELEDLLRDKTSSGKQDLLATVQGQRIALAYEIGRFDLVLDRSSRFVLAYPASHPSFSNVAVLRMRALHSTGAHKAEIYETLAIARRPEIKGGEYVSLLENLGVRHPGSIPSDEQLSAKLMEAISELNAQGYEITLPIASGKTQLDETAMRVASELRRANRAKSEELLSGSA